MGMGVALMLDQNQLPVQLEREESRLAIRGNLEGSVRSRGRTGPEHERERDLIEAGLNEPLPQRWATKNSSRPMVCDDPQPRTRTQLGRYGTDIAKMGK